MFNREFFSSPDWHEKLQRFSTDDDANDAKPLRVTFVTQNGHRYDVQRFTFSNTGMNLYLRDSGDLVFLPYGQIGQVETSIMADRGAVGFTA